MRDRADQQFGPRKPVAEAGRKAPPDRPPASLDRLEEPVAAPGPEEEQRRAGGREHHPVGAPDQVFERHEADAAAELR